MFKGCKLHTGKAQRKNIKQQIHLYRNLAMNKSIERNGILKEIEKDKKSYKIPKLVGLYTN